MGSSPPSAARSARTVITPVRTTAGDRNVRGSAGSPQVHGPSKAAGGRSGLGAEPRGGASLTPRALEPSPAVPRARRPAPGLGVPTPPQGPGRGPQAAFRVVALLFLPVGLRWVPSGPVPYSPFSVSNSHPLKKHPLFRSGKTTSVFGLAPERCGEARGRLAPGESDLSVSDGSSCAEHVLVCRVGVFDLLCSSSVS